MGPLGQIDRRLFNLISKIELIYSLLKVQFELLLLLLMLLFSLLFSALSAVCPVVMKQPGFSLTISILRDDLQVLILQMDIFFCLKQVYGHDNKFTKVKNFRATKTCVKQVFLLADNYSSEIYDARSSC